MTRLRTLTMTSLAAITMTATSLLAQADVELVFQTERTSSYETWLDSQEVELSTQLDNGVGVDAARMSLILIKLARIQLEAGVASGQISDGSDEIDAALDDLAQRIGDSRDDDGNDIEARINSANNDIEAALEDLGDVLEEETEDISDLAADLQDSDEPFEVTFRIEGDGLRDDEIVTITRADLDELADAIGDGAASGRSLVAAVGHLRAAADAWGDALDVLDVATTAEDNQVAIDAMRAGTNSLDAAFLSLEAAFDSSPLETGVDTKAARTLLADLDDILAGRTFAIGDHSVRPVALIESRTQAAYRSLDGLQPALLLSRLAQIEFDRADDHEGIDDGRAQKAQVRGWTLVMTAAGAVGLSDKASALLLEFWSSTTPAEETLRGYFPDGMSDAMLEVLGVDLVVNTSASGDEMDAHMHAMRERYAGRISQDPDDSEAHAGLALVRTYFLVADNHQDVFDIIDMAMEGDVLGIVDRFDTEDFDYSASLDSTDLDLDAAREDADMVFLVIDKMDDDGSLFAIEANDDIIALPLTGGLLDTALNLIGNVAAAATALAEAGSDALAQMEQSVELDLDPNELDFTDSDSALGIALALEVSNADFLRMSPEGASNLVDMGERIEEALDDFSGAVSEG